jgi:hypothetical protein
VEPEKLFIPTSWMDDLYAGRISVSGGRMKVNVDIRTARPDDRAAALFGVQRILQRLAPNLHHWNRSVFFSTDRLPVTSGGSPSTASPLPSPTPGNGCSARASTRAATSTSASRTS